MKRFFDIIMSLVAILILGIPMLVIAALVKITSKGPVIHWSDRIGQYNIIFKMPKFRTMKNKTPIIATALFEDMDLYLIPIGKVLRDTSIDELPQLISILKGDMSFVGPRPVLVKETCLIKLRTEMGVYVLPHGLTGLAQINGRDKLSVSEKVAYDVDYLHNRSLLLDIKIILSTFIKVLKMEGINPF